MKEPVTTGEIAPRAMLVSIRDDTTSAAGADSFSRELAGLVKTLGLEIASLETVCTRETQARYGMGSGKAEELSKKAAGFEADCIVFDRDISPSRQRNWEKLSGLSVIDRQELIIQIFAGRARSREAELQVSLAELKYSLPRLQHKYIDLSRQRGGRYGTRGSGETRLETDRRRVEQRIHRLEEELEQIRRQRQVQRRQRERQGLPVCALVGYTNAGKSTLFNALTGASVFAEDKLFATLDSTSRRVELSRGLTVLLSDTVGFIRNLPHNLIDAFRSTLEEASRADVLVNVLDASGQDIAEHYETTLSVLRELGAENIPVITVLNKIDCLTADAAPPGEISGGKNTLGDLLKRFPESIPLSALEASRLREGDFRAGEKNPPGLSALRERIERVLSGTNRRFRFPPERTDLSAMIYRSGTVVSEKYGDNFIEMEARVDERAAGKLREFEIRETARDE